MICQIDDLHWFLQLLIVIGGVTAFLLIACAFIGFLICTGIGMDWLIRLGEKKVKK